VSEDASLPPTPREKFPLALVMGGGGARAAYQAGCLRAISKRFPDLRFPIITGVSAGAINAVHMAAHPGTFAEAAEDLTRLWESLSIDRVFRVSPRYLGLNALRWGVQLASGGLVGPPRVRGLVDTEPLREFLSGHLPQTKGVISGIEANVRSGKLRALAISTSSYTTGRSVTWIQGEGIEEWERPQRRVMRAPIGIDHIMASAAIPLFFPAVQIGDEWYGDGGIRLFAPLSPAIHMGAGRILTISTRFERLLAEAERPMVQGYPPPAQIVGSLMNSVFLDLIDQDAWRVEVMNQLLRKIPEVDRDELRVVDLLILRPSRDLGKDARDFETTLPSAFRFLVRGLGTRETKSPDVLSFLLFDPGYIRFLVEMGERDTEVRMGEVEGMLGGNLQKPLNSEDSESRDDP